MPGPPAPIPVSPAYPAAPAWPGGVWLVGCHGGAGTSTLAAVGLGADGHRTLPTPRATPAGLLLVARYSATGLTAASEAGDMWQRGRFPAGLTLLGLVLVAAAPGKPPRLARERHDLVAGWYPAVWHLKWLPELLGTDDPSSCEPLRAALPRDLTTLLTTGRRAP